MHCIHAHSGHVNACIHVLTLIHTMYSVHVYIYLKVALKFKWLVSHTPYLIQQTPIAPHITGCGVLLVVDSLWCSPLDGNGSTFGYIVVL